MKQNTLRQLSGTIEKIMQAKRMNATDLAKKANISYSSLIPILNGVRECGISKLIAIANALGCTTDALLTGLVNVDNVDNLDSLIAGERRAPKYFAVFISIVKVSYCLLYDIKTKGAINAVFQFPLRCSEDPDTFLDNMVTSIQKLSTELNPDMVMKDVAVFASIQQYGRRAARLKIQHKGNQLFSMFMLESDAITNHHAFIGNSNGICVSINDGGVITYSADKGKMIDSLMGYGFPVTDIVGNYWLGCEAIKHAIAVKQSREPASLVSDRLLALYSDDVDFLAQYTVERAGESYVAASAIVKELMHHKAKSHDIVKRSVHLLNEYIKVIDQRTKTKLPLFFAGELAYLYESYFEAKRLIRIKKPRNLILFDYGLAKLKEAAKALLKQKGKQCQLK